jgi:integrase
LGHTSIVTTDNYYDQFEDDAHREIARKYISAMKT